MKRLWMHLMILFLSIHLTACATKSSDVTNTDNYDTAHKVAWNYLEEMGWQETTENWQDADVKKVVVDENYELLDETYLGKEVLNVSFEVTDHSAVSTPMILIDNQSEKVIGYMLVE